MKYSNHQIKYSGKQVGLRTYQHLGTLQHATAVLLAAFSFLHSSIIVLFSVFQQLTT